MDIAPDYAEAHNNLGYLFFQERRADDAIAQFKAALRIQPDYAESHNNLGIVYHAQDASTTPSANIARRFVLSRTTPRRI